MLRKWPILLSFLCAVMLVSTMAYAETKTSGLRSTELPDSVTQWRSNLYPEDWTPCYADSSGRFLQDFSYAGYHSGTKSIPSGFLAPVIDVTQSPYKADNSGRFDATEAIQRAIDDVGRQGGGTVYLPPGQYNLSIQDAQRNYALRITHSNVRLMGAGPDETFLFFEGTEMRSKAVIRIFSGSNWRTPSGGTQSIAEPLVYPTQIIPLDGAPRFNVGDWVVITHDTTDAWIEDHYMEDMWSRGSLPGATMYRQVIAVNDEDNTITIDAPIRYYLLPRDNARVYHVPSHLEEVGISDLAIGMAEHPGSGWGETDYKFPGTGGYAVHGSHAISFSHVVNSWVNNVKSYKPGGNKWVHLLSNGILVSQSRFVTIDSVDLRNPQYRGSGGNGYHFTLISNDSLIINSAAYNGRHNYDFKQATSNGNVITHSYASSPDSRNSDFHMHLSPSNLIDHLYLDEERFDAGWHGSFGTPSHALTTTQSVLWNLYGERYKRQLREIIYTEQYGWGYVIGTQGPANGVRTALNTRTIIDEDGDYKEMTVVNRRTLPEDYVEGVGKGAGLAPQSLYFDQFERRKNRDEVVHCPGLDFRPPVPRISIHHPDPHETVRGRLQFDIDILPPMADVQIEEIRVHVDEIEMFGGKELSEPIIMDSMDWQDGSYRLTVEAWSNNGLTAKQSVPFRVSNHWQLRDALDAPIEKGFFGVIPRHKTVEASEGWTYDTSDPATFFGDDSRRVRIADSEEYLTWEASGLQHFSISLYSQTPNIRDYIRLEVSKEDLESTTSWQEIAFNEEILQRSHSGWNHIVLSGDIPQGLQSQLFRIRLLPASDDKTSDRNMSGSIQIGSVDLNGLNL